MIEVESDEMIAETIVVAATAAEAAELRRDLECLFSSAI
jgi:hypothetical protein